MPSLGGFETALIETGDARIFIRKAGTGPALLLLHGYPQTHLCWSRIAPQLAEHFTVVLADLTGYGRSMGPTPTANGSNYAKRAVAASMVAMMERLGYSRFHLAGHDRGARVAYRLALDHGERVERLALLSILPTCVMWDRLGDIDNSINTYHWFMLSQTPPIAQDILAGSPDTQVRNTIASWTKTRTLAAFNDEELCAYADALRRPEARDAICADYRAAWTTDRDHDLIDTLRRRHIACPSLSLWGEDEYSRKDMRNGWSKLAPAMEFQPLDCGHFVVEERPRETLSRLQDFFSA